MVKFYAMARPDLEKSLMSRTFEGQGISASQAHFLAYYSEGSLGIALRLKDHGLFDEKNRIIDLFCGIGTQADDPVSLASRQDLLVSFNVLASWFRDIYLLKSGAPAGDLVHSDRMDDLARDASRYSLRDLDRVVEALSESALNVSRNLNKKLLVSNVITACRQSLTAFA